MLIMMEVSWDTLDMLAKLTTRPLETGRDARRNPRRGDYRTYFTLKST